jgi:thiol-disulfide isomerase/thioredoxin
VGKVSSILKGFFRVAAVNGDSESLSLYGDDRQAPVAYDGEFISDRIVSWVLAELDNVIASRAASAKELKAFQEYQEREKERANKEWKEEEELRKKSNTLLLDYANWESGFLRSREPFLINFYESNNSACIELNREWELLSTELKGKVRVAKINITETENHRLEDQLRLTRYPSVRFYKHGPKKVEEYTQYDGVYKKFSLLEWVSARLAEKATQADIAVLNKENYETLCKATKNTCIIVFLDGSEADDLTSQLEKLALDHIKKPITFLVSRKGEQDAFAKQVGVSSYPDTVMVYCKLKKVWHMEGLDLQAIEDGINEISLGNRNNFVRLAFTENIQ